MHVIESDQSINQSINQSIDQSINQAINQRFFNMARIAIAISKFTSSR